MADGTANGYITGQVYFDAFQVSQEPHRQQHADKPISLLLAAQLPAYTPHHWCSVTTWQPTCLWQLLLMVDGMPLSQCCAGTLWPWWRRHCADGHSRC